MQTAELIDLVEGAYEDEHGIRTSIPAVTQALSEITERLDSAERAMQAAREDCHPAIEAYFAKYGE